MSFLESERARLVSLRDELFDDPGSGLYRQIPSRLCCQTR